MTTLLGTPHGHTTSAELNARRAPTWPTKLRVARLDRAGLFARVGFAGADLCAGEGFGAREEALGLWCVALPV